MKRFQFNDKHTYSRNIKLFSVVGIIIGVFGFQFADSQFTQRITFGIITITGYISLRLNLKNMSKVVAELIIHEEILEMSFVNKIKPTREIDYSNLRADIDGDKISFSEKTDFIGTAYRERLLPNQNWDDLIAELNTKENS